MVATRRWWRSTSPRCSWRNLLHLSRFRTRRWRTFRSELWISASTWTKRFSRPTCVVRPDGLRHISLPQYISKSSKSKSDLLAGLGGHFQAERWREIRKGKGWKGKTGYGKPEEGNDPQNGGLSLPSLKCGSPSTVLGHRSGGMKAARHEFGDFVFITTRCTCSYTKTVSNVCTQLLIMQSCLWEVALRFVLGLRLSVCSLRAWD